eukprot:UN03366
MAHASPNRDVRHLHQHSSPSSISGSLFPGISTTKFPPPPCTFHYNSSKHLDAALKRILAQRKNKTRSREICRYLFQQNLKGVQ